MVDLKRVNGEKTRRILIGGFFSMLVLMTILSVVSLYENDILADLTDKLYRHPMTVSNAVLDANANIISMHSYMKDVAQADNDEEFDAAVKLVKFHEKKVSANFNIIMDRFLGDKTKIIEAQQAFQDWKAIRNEVIVLTRNNRPLEAADISKGKEASHVHILTMRMHGLIDFAQNKAAEFLTESHRQKTLSRVILLTLLALVVLIGGGVAVFVIRKVYQVETGLIKSEAALKESERALSTLIANLQGMAYRCRNDKNWSMDFVSSGTKMLTGYDPEDIINNAVVSYNDLIHPNDQERVWKTVQSALEHNHPFDVNYRIQHRDGSLIQAREQGRGVFADNGQLLAIEGFIADITQQVMAEKQLHLLKDEAERANKAKSEFLASMSHELRTPLNAVMGFAQLLKYNPQHALSPDQSDHVECIITGGEHLLELVNEVLDLARIEADRVSFDIKNICANTVIADCVSLTQPLGTARGITISNAISDTPETYLLTDALRFKQVIINLLSNAIKYNIDHGGVFIEGRETQSGFFRVSVRDTGIGIAAENLSSVFELFHRIGADSNIAREGTGVGLTVTKLLIERMAGRVGVESEEGVGSTFWFELPLASNTDTLIWTENFRVGVDPIDGDHQQIIVYMNKAFHAVISPLTSPEILSNAFSKLVKYTENHFKREEAIMELCQFPHLDSHRREHRHLQKKLNDMIDSFYNDDTPNSIEFYREFFHDWWVGHIMKSDAQITQYADSQKIAIERLLAHLK